MAYCFTMERSIRWGILGPGKIAHKFAAAFERVPTAKLYAVASRDAFRGKEFAEKFGIGKIYTRYEDLADDPDIDIIYVATPHPFHHAQSLLCLNKKKAVLCEKPLTMSYQSAREMVSTARVQNAFLMEGMWSRFFPSMIKTEALVREGTIGEIRFIRADFGFASVYDPAGRVFDLRLGGGAQLDVGVYPLFLVLLLLGKPDKIQAITHRLPTGADETTAVQFHFNNGSLAHILSSVAIDTPKQAEIIGTSGTITLHAPWHKSQALTLTRNSGKPKKFDFPYSGFGFEFELREVTNQLIQGNKECEGMSLNFSLMMADAADEILRQCGVVYPMGQVR